MRHHALVLSDVITGSRATLVVHSDGGPLWSLRLGDNLVVLTQQQLRDMLTALVDMIDVDDPVDTEKERRQLRLRKEQLIEWLR